MGSNKTAMERLVRVLQMKMPVNVVGESDDIEGNSDKIRVLAKEKPNSVILFIMESSPERTEYVVENILEDHNSQYERKDSRGQMRVKYVVNKVDNSTFV